MDEALLISEFKYRTSRSGGKGGQHVNKVETKVEAVWSLEESQAVTAAEKLVLAAKFGENLTADGLLSAIDQSSRSQLKNKERANRKLLELVKNALKKEKKRKWKPLQADTKKRLEAKRRRAETKATRQKPTL